MEYKSAHYYLDELMAIQTTLAAAIHAVEPEMLKAAWANVFRQAGLKCAIA